MSFEEVFHLSLKQLSLIIGGGALGHAAGCSDPVVPLHCCYRSHFLPQTQRCGHQGSLSLLPARRGASTADTRGAANSLVTVPAGVEAGVQHRSLASLWPRSDRLALFPHITNPPRGGAWLRATWQPAPPDPAVAASAVGTLLACSITGASPAGPVGWHVLHLTLWCPHSLPFCIPLFQSCPLHFQSVASSHSPLAVPAALMFLASFRLSPLLSLPPPSPRDVALPFSICPIVSPLFIWVLELQVLSFSATAQNVSHRLCGWIITRYRTTWGFPAKPPSPPVRGGDRISEITFSVVVVVVVLKGRKPGEKLGSSSFGNTRW